MPMNDTWYGEFSDHQKMVHKDVLGLLNEEKRCLRNETAVDFEGGFIEVTKNSYTATRMAVMIYLIYEEVHSDD